MNIDVKLNIDMEVNQIKREALIREYERRIAVLKNGGSPSEAAGKTVTLGPGATINLNQAEPKAVSTKDAIRNCIEEMARTWSANAKDGGRIVLTEDDLQEDSRKECAVLEKAEEVILRRFQDCLDSEKPLSADDFRDIMNSRNTPEWILKMKGAYGGPLSTKERVICEKAEDIILKQYQFWLDSEKPMSSDDFNAMMDSVKTMDCFSGMKGARMTGGGYERQ